jgi:hypothetical protein
VVPPAPSNAQATAPISSPNTVALTWDPDTSGNVKDYEVNRGTSPNGPWTNLGTVPAGSRGYADTGSGLACNTTYYYQVRTINGNGNSDYVTIQATTAGCKIYLPIINKKP